MKSTQLWQTMFPTRRLQAHPHSSFPRLPIPHPSDFPHTRPAGPSKSHPGHQRRPWPPLRPSTYRRSEGTGWAGSRPYRGLGEAAGAPLAVLAGATALTSLGREHCTKAMYRSTSGFVRSNPAPCLAIRPALIFGDSAGFARGKRKRWEASKHMSCTFPLSSWQNIEQAGSEHCTA